MVYTHKTAPELEIKTLTAARAFAALGERLGGTGVLKCITTRKYDPMEWRLGYFSPAGN